MELSPKFQIEHEDDAYAVLRAVDQLYKNSPDRLIDENFPKQAAFLRSTAKRKAALCTRRAGKSYGIGSHLFRKSILYPGSSALYLGLTRESARNIMWKDILKELNRRFELRATPNETMLTMKLPNGSEIKLAGVDSSKEEMEKFLGGKYTTIVIDEPGSMRQDLRKLIYENLEPAVADYDGDIILTGTPTALTKSLFFDVTHPDRTKRERGWEVHQWNTFDNPYMESKWRDRIDKMIELNPKVVETPFFRRMYLGQWVLDLDDLCYKYSDEINYTEALPDQEYTYVLGIDLGFSPDPSAFVVCAYSHHDRNLYIVDAYKEKEMIISDVAERIRYYDKTYAPQLMVIDNASKQAVEELKQRFGLPLTAADKHGKAEFIEIMNSEMLRGAIKALPKAEALTIEWENLIWDDKKDKRVEHPNCENHLSDAALYAWRHCYQHFSEPRVEKSLKTDVEVVDEWWDAEGEKLERYKKLQYWEKT